MSWTLTIRASGSNAHSTPEEISGALVRRIVGDGHTLELATLNGQAVDARFPDRKAEIVRKIIIEAVAGAWATPANSHKAMDPDLANAIVDNVLKKLLPDN